MLFYDFILSGLDTGTTLYRKAFDSVNLDSVPLHPKLGLDSASIPFSSRFLWGKWGRQAVPRVFARPLVRQLLRSHRSPEK